MPASALQVLGLKAYVSMFSWDLKTLFRSQRLNCQPRVSMSQTWGPSICVADVHLGLHCRSLQLAQGLSQNLLPAYGSRSPGSLPCLASEGGLCLVLKWLDVPGWAAALGAPPSQRSGGSRGRNYVVGTWRKGVLMLGYRINKLINESYFNWQIR